MWLLGYTLYRLGRIEALVQTAWTSVKVSRELWRLLDAIGQQTGLKKGILIEKAVAYFVTENREALSALGLDYEIIQRLLNEALTVQAEAA